MITLQIIPTILFIEIFLQIAPNVHSQPVSSVDYIISDVSEKSSWTTANKTCYERGEQFARFKSVADLQLVQSKLQDSQSYWIGLRYKGGSFVWANDEKIPKALLENLTSSKEADLINEGKDCFCLSARNLSLCLSCTVDNPFICQKRGGFKSYIQHKEKCQLCLNNFKYFIFSPSNWCIFVKGKGCF